jgi:hypothetical protein
MSSTRPTLPELRAVVQKQRHREIGNWLARRVARPTAVFGTWAAIRLGLSAHQVTLASLIASLAGAAAIGSGRRLGFVAGVGGLLLGFWLDHVDGQVARWRRTASLDGVYLDYLMHHAVNLALGFGLGFGLSVRSGQLFWALCGFAIALGWCLLSIHNDCRYKAFFQRLKSTDEAFLVVGGSGGKPAPPAPWPRRGLAAFTWPAYKACEPHVVLISLIGMAVLSFFHEELWLNVWRVGVAGMALMTPLLATARIARSVCRQSVEAEFARWFQSTLPRAPHDRIASRPATHRPLDSMPRAIVSPGNSHDRSIGVSPGHPGREPGEDRARCRTKS